MLDSVVANGHTFEECKEVLRQSRFFCLCFVYDDLHYVTTRYYPRCRLQELL